MGPYFIAFAALVFGVINWRLRNRHARGLWELLGRSGEHPPVVATIIGLSSVVGALVFAAFAVSLAF